MDGEWHRRRGWKSGIKKENERGRTKGRKVVKQNKEGE